MTRSSILRWTLAALLVALLAIPASAQTVGRVSISVVDQEENPIKDVEITATNEGSSFNEVRTTNKKGKTTFAFRDGTLVYQLTLIADGFQPSKANLKPDIGKVKYVTYTLQKLQAAAPAAAAENAPPAKLTPAEQAFNDGVQAQKDGDTATAKAKFLEALSLDDQLTVAHSGLAALYFEEGDFQSMLASAQLITEREPENPRGFRLLYEAHKALGNGDEADDALAQLNDLVEGSDAAALVFNEGAEAVRVGDFKRGRERMERALSIDPELMPAVRALAFINIQDGNYTEAATMAEKFLAANPDDMLAKRIRLDAYVGLGDEAKAQEARQAIVADDPTVITKPLFERAQAAFNSGNTEAAMKDLIEVVTFEDTNAKAHYMLGLCYVNKGDNANAKKHLEKFVALAPEDPDAASASEMVKYLN